MRNSQQNTRFEPRSETGSLNFDRSLITTARPEGQRRTRRTESGGGERIRTDDILLAKQALYQLSYAPDANLRSASTCDSGMTPSRKSTPVPTSSGHPLDVVADAQLSATNKRLRVCSWWAREDLNLRPHAYQARALTN
jgi:hypothetical protein